MTVPVLFYSPNACSFGSIVVAEWLGLPYQLCRVEGKLRSTEAFKRINPLGKVGALKVGDHLLAENFAILTYLVWQKPGTNLTPSHDDLNYHVMNQWLSYLASGFHVAFSPLFGVARFSDDENDFERIKAAGVKNVRKQYDYVNNHLANNDYFMGKQKTILDAYFYGLARWGKNFFDVEKDYPHVARHQKLMEQDKAVQFALAIEKGEDVKSPSGAFEGHVDLSTL